MRCCSILGARSWPIVLAAVGLGSLALATAAVLPSTSSPPTTAEAAAVGESEAGDEATSAALERALEAVSIETIRSDIFTIASDEMGGRNTPSEGQNEAARYLVQRLEQLGVPPGYKDGYLHPYSLVHVGLIPEKSSCTIDGKADQTLTLGEDYFLMPGSFESSKVKGAVVPAGTGDRDDLKRINLKGKWALIAWAEQGAPGEGPDPAQVLGQIANSVEKADGVGLLVLPGQGYDEKRLAERMKGSVEYLVSGNVSWPGETGRRFPRRRPGRIPTVVLSPQGAAKFQETVQNTTEQELERGKALKGIQFRAEHEFHDADHLGKFENVCAFWPGEDKKLSKEVLIISAHYDHVGYLPDGRIRNGADDNGSGTTGLLSLAEALVAHGPMKRSIMLIWVSGEEKGLYGSRAWVEDPWLPKGCKAVANINIDMIGRNEPDKLLITPTRTGRYSKQYNGLVRRAEQMCSLEGFPKLGSADLYYERSDQANFHKLGIPVCFLFTDIHEDYHQPTDTADKVDLDKIRRVVRLVVRILADLQEKKLGI